MQVVGVLGFYCGSDDEVAVILAMIDIADVVVDLWLTIGQSWHERRVTVIM